MLYFAFYGDFSVLDIDVISPGIIRVKLTVCDNV